MCQRIASLFKRDSGVEATSSEVLEEGSEEHPFLP